MNKKVKMGLVTILVFCVGISFAYATSNCANISGSWQNELGSRMELTVDESNRISGEYHTAVEAEHRAAAFVSNLTGLFSQQSDGAVLTFSVLFNRGHSLASWVGQCMVCEGKEVLQMTYTLRKYVPNQRDKWTAVIVNQNSFWRLEDEADSTSNSLPTAVSTVNSKVLETQHGGLDLSGKWKSSNNEEVEFFRMKGNILEGRTTCCHPSSNFAGKHHLTDVIGRKDGNGLFTAVTLMSATNNRVRSWTGHIYASSVPVTLETSWLEHEFSPSCSNARNMVRIGSQNFTRITPEFANIVNKSETFMDKVRKFFTNMF